MALSKPTSEEDRTRFFRLNLVIIEELTPMLQDFLLREILPSQILNIVKRDLSHLRTHQIVQVKNAKTMGYKEFDITLLYALLRNYCPNIKKPTHGWGVQSMPKQGEITEGDDIERIRIIKNEQLSHKPILAVTEAKFEELWNIISDICSRMQDRLPNTQYVKRLEEAKNRTIDSEMENTIMEKFEELAEEEKSIKELLLKLLEKTELTSVENVVIRNARENEEAETLCNIIICILNEMVDAIQGLTSESDIERLYKSIEAFITENKGDIDNTHLKSILKRLGEKITAYANLQMGTKMTVLDKYLKFIMRLKKNYGACVESSQGSLILTVTFSSKEGYDCYKKDLEKGIIGQQILQLILFPPFLASFDLKAEDLIVYLNDQELSKGSGDKSIYNTSSTQETCADHPNQYHTMVCQQCQLPVCVLCMEKHKDHNFMNYDDLLREIQVELREKLEKCLTIKHEKWMDMKKIVADVNEIQSRMTSKHQALQLLLAGVLQNNMKHIEKFRKSQIDNIEEKLNDIENYISNLIESLNETYENPPAQALFQLRSHSLKEVLFDKCETVYPTFVENDTDFLDVNHLFGTLRIPQMPVHLDSKFIRLATLVKKM